MCSANDFVISPGCVVNKNNPCFVIAEIGQNHQGDKEIAKQLIDASKAAGANCVKFQKSCLTEKFNASALNRPYSGQHSWGKTYGEHKKYLEFSVEDFRELQNYAKNIDIIFSASAMDSVSVDILHDMNVPFIKIGSGDTNNFPLLEYAASKNRPIVISTVSCWRSMENCLNLNSKNKNKLRANLHATTFSMQDLKTVRAVYTLMKKMKANFSLLHCVSSYPVPVDQINLEVINLYKSEFPDIQIGYSGHELGTMVSVAAVAMGARIVERHITLDTSWKGTDHKSSLTPVEFSKMVLEIRKLEKALGKPIKIRQPCELDCFMKLGKTVVAGKYLKQGMTLRKEDVKIKVADPKGCPAESLNFILGRALIRDVEEDESIMEDDVV